MPLTVNLKEDQFSKLKLEGRVVATREIGAYKKDAVAVFNGNRIDCEAIKVDREKICLVKK